MAVETTALGTDQSLQHPHQRAFAALGLDNVRTLPRQGDNLEPGFQLHQDARRGIQERTIYCAISGTELAVTSHNHATEGFAKIRRLQKTAAFPIDFSQSDWQERLTASWPDITSQPGDFLTPILVGVRFLRSDPSKDSLGLRMIDEQLTQAGYLPE